MPDDFQTPDAWIEDGAAARSKHGLPVADLRLEAARFENHWKSKNDPKRDWRRTWLNWCTSPYCTAAVSPARQGGAGLFPGR